MTHDRPNGPEARALHTHLRWTDLELPASVLAQLESIKQRLSRPGVNDAEGRRPSARRGEAVLFQGLPGTGKTLAATLLANAAGLEVYAVDLSRVVSKYIGETEKNLERVFAAAEGKSWILMFDEADALFGKRADVADSHDRYANPEIAYLLQRLESYAGLAILATNRTGDIDPAVLRRFASIVRFPPRRTASRA